MKKTIIALLISLALISCSGGSDSGSSGGSGITDVTTGTTTGTTTGETETTTGTTGEVTTDSNERLESLVFSAKQIMIKAGSTASSSLSADGRIASVVGETCSLGANDTGTYIPILEKEGTCAKKMQFNSTGEGYFSYEMDDSTTVTNENYHGNIVGSRIVYHTFREASGKLHYLNKVPVQDSVKLNKPMVERLDDDTVIYQNGGKVIARTLSTGTESDINTETATRHDILETSTGKQVITWGAEFKKWKDGADITPSNLSILNGKTGLISGNTIIHEQADNTVSANTEGQFTFFDENGDKDKTVRWNHIEYQKWIDDGMITGSPNGEQGVSLRGKVEGDYFLSNKVYKKGGVDSDFEDFKIWNYGHTSIQNMSDSRFCAKNGNLYFFGENNSFVGMKLTYISEEKAEIRDIDTNHKFTKLVCYSNNTVIGIGERYDDGIASGVIETVTFKNANLETFERTVETGISDIADSF